MADALSITIVMPYKLIFVLNLLVWLQIVRGGDSLILVLPLVVILAVLSFSSTCKLPVVVGKFSI